MPLNGHRNFAILWVAVLWLPRVLVPEARGQTAAPLPVTLTNALVLEIEGRVEALKLGGTDWTRVQTNQWMSSGARVRTGERSRAVLQLSSLATLRLGELSIIEIPGPQSESSGFNFRRGLFYFFHRDKPAVVPLRTPAGVAVIRGTEFSLQVAETGRTLVQVLDGTVDLANDAGNLQLNQGEAGEMSIGVAPQRTAALPAIAGIQWVLYYPGLINPDELPLPPPTATLLADSLASYREGDLLQALASYPPNRKPMSPSESVYLAGLLLSVGQAEASEQWLASLGTVSTEDPVARLASALRLLIGIVQLRTAEPTLTTKTDSVLSTELMAESYRLQAQGNLDGARTLVRQAVILAPRFGFALARLAELEFGFGNTKEARRRLDQSLEAAPRNAQAVALAGFLLAADNQPTAALSRFDQAIAIDGALGNAWLGRGLTRIRQGERDGGRLDLQVACTLEPQRAVLRSYLGKAFNEQRDLPHAERELLLAQRLDPNDPSAWLYSALLRQQQNRINDGIQDLERSQALNDHRQVYRSRLLLDRDQAVRGANLAGIYRDAGLTEVSLREATRAVSLDYGNYSAHLFLSESFNALRDPTRFNLRQETPWFSEWLLASLLSPVGGTPLGQNISQQEYSRFFERDQLGLVSQTEYRSDGQVREVASQFGRYHDTAYAVDLDLQHQSGVRPNQELDRLELYTTLKHQLGPQDSLLVLTKIQNYQSGDNFQYYDPAVARRDFYYQEYQTPGALVAGYHREWAPGIHTLLLGGRLANDQRLGDRNATNSLAIRAGDGSVLQLVGVPFDVDYRGEFHVWTGEVNQIVQGERHALVIGGRYQAGTFETWNQMLLSPSVAGSAGSFPNPPALGSAAAAMERISGYAYWTWELAPRLQLTPGLAYDQLQFPVNHRHPPVQAGEDRVERFNPKGALVWSPRPMVTVRGAYARSLGGVSFDESYRLEPTQLAGFSQAFRSLLPESLAGSVSAPQFETAGVGLDLRLRPRSYVTLELQRLASDVERTIGDFQSPPFPFFATPGALRETLDYREHAVALTLNQLVSEEWSLGARYQFTRAELDRRLPEVPTSVFDGARRLDSGDFHQAAWFAVFNHPSGWFATTDVSWYWQSSSVTADPGGSATRQRAPAEVFPQINLVLGFRFLQRRGEIAVGGLNLTGEDYRLNPISLYPELPRERVFYARVRLRF